AAVQYRSAEHPRAQLVWSAARYLFEHLRLWFWLPGRSGVLLGDDPTQHGLSNTLAWCALVIASVWLWRMRGRDPARDFACFFAALTLLPLTNFVPIGHTPVAMHYTFLPGLGLALWLARTAQRVKPAWLPAVALAVLVAAWLPEQRRAFAGWSSATN